MQLDELDAMDVPSASEARVDYIIRREECNKPLKHQIFFEWLGYTFPLTRNY